MTLTEFLLARLDPAETECAGSGGYRRCHEVSERFEAAVVTMRQVVAIHQQGVTQYGDPAQWCLGCGGEYGDAPSPCPTLTALALPYADHPDYDPTWKP